MDTWPHLYAPPPFTYRNQAVAVCVYINCFIWADEKALEPNGIHIHTVLYICMYAKHMRVEIRYIFFGANGGMGKGLMIRVVKHAKLNPK